MENWAKFSALIAQPDALRGIESLIDYARRMVDRYTVVPIRKPAEQKLARSA